MEFDFRSVSFKRKFGSNLFARNLIIGCSKKRPRKIFPNFDFSGGRERRRLIFQICISNLVLFSISVILLHGSQKTFP